MYAFHSHKNREKNNPAPHFTDTSLYYFFSNILVIETTLNYTVEGKQAAVFTSWISPLFCNQSPILKT